MRDFYTEKSELILCIIFAIIPLSCLDSTPIKEHPITKFEEINFEGEQTIPRIIHHIWYEFSEDKKVPQQYEEWAQQLQDLHPGWEYIRWNKKDCRNFIKDNYPWFLETYDGYDKHMKRIDAVRYFILHKVG